jgi:hypothetical protein
MESILALFVHVDDFCKAFLPFWNRQLLSCGAQQRQRERSLSLSEIMTVLIAFHQSHYRDFKAYYYEQVLKHWRSEFPGLVSYNRFVEFIPSALVPLCACQERNKKSEKSRRESPLFRDENVHCNSLTFAQNHRTLTNSSFLLPAW